MEEKDIYEKWRKKRAEVTLPEGFVDRVMTSVHKAKPLKVKKQRATFAFPGNFFEIPIIRFALGSGLGVLGCVRFYSVLGALVP